MTTAPWNGVKVLVTGHTGFKGAWLSWWLTHLGAEVHGLALAPPTAPSLFELAGLAGEMRSTEGDIRDFALVQQFVARTRPEIVFHLAAQSLVRPSYADPIGTFATNVMGTLHVLEAVRHAGSAHAVVAVTSDKCYENRERVEPYRESDHLGGADPYSGSKGAAEIAVASFSRSFSNEGGGLPPTATARAGNVIGGGDYATDRLVPDLLRAFADGRPAMIRNPNAVRPWQHVLEPLSGYLALGERLLRGDSTVAEPWNFGPADDDAWEVRAVADLAVTSWGSGASWHTDAGTHPHEARLLRLDASKARERLHWKPRWSVREAVNRTVEWHRAALGNTSPNAIRALIDENIIAYERAGGAQSETHTAYVDSHA